MGPLASYAERAKVREQRLCKRRSPHPHPLSPEYGGEGLYDRIEALSFMTQPLPIVKIDHVSVLITDVERSRRFYAGILGLREINKPRTFDFVAVWFDLGDQHLHLLQKDKPDTISARHFALRVT